jgi:PAS domain S-box-containing protein
MLVNYIDSQQCYRFANQTYATWFGTPVQDIVGRSVADVVGASTWAKVASYLQAALQGIASVHENQLFVSGQQRELRVQFIPQWDKGGQVEGVVTVISDISEYKATEQRLAQAVERATEKLRKTNEALVQRNLDLQQFSFIASHDLRTPLRSVKGYLTLLQARYASGLNAKGQELIGRATAALGQMDGLTEDLLSYVRLDSPAQPLEPVDCNEVLRDTLNFLDASMTETGTQVTVETLPTVMGERGQLVQLFQNLLSNAIKYCRRDAPRIRVSAQRGASEWIFEVADNGIGIEPQHLTRIFEVFKRLHTAQEYPGTGIGLAICQRIAVRHGGRIWVTSEPGRGSSFFFSIPDKDKAA